MADGGKTMPQGRSNGLLELARMMVKQAIMLRRTGLKRDAIALARRAIEINTLGHAQLKPKPVKLRVN
jgi:hypothetical protein